MSTSRKGQYGRTMRAKLGDAGAAKAERCVEHVKSSGKSANPWAVCTASITGKRRGSGSRKM